MRVLTLIALIALTGCGTTLGSKNDPWLQIPNGISIGFSMNNVDHALDRKGLNIEKVDNRKMDRY